MNSLEKARRAIAHLGFTREDADALAVAEELTEKKMQADYSLIRVFDTSAEWVIHHITTLPESDIYLRFGFQANENQIRKYVEKSLSTETTRTHADMWYAIKFDGEIVATLHVAIRDDLAEFAFTTSPEHRNKGLGQMLFGRGVQLISEFSIKNVYMAMLTRNSAMRHIAKKFGMNVVTQGSESEASFTIESPVPLSRFNEVRYSLIDSSLFSDK